MKRIRFGLLPALGLAVIGLAPAARVGTPRNQLPLAPAGSSLATTPATTPGLNETLYFGGTTWAPDSMRWEALPDSVWTFDSGVGSSIKEPGQTYPGVDPDKLSGLHATMEGWVGLDRTHRFGNTGPYFRRVSASDPRWEPGSACVGIGAGLGGDYSFWAGVFPDEAAGLCYAAGQGYGDNWNICIGHGFYLPRGSDDVDLEYDYWNDTEDGWDYTQVRVEWGGVLHEITAYTGVQGGHETLTLTRGNELPQGPASITLEFCVESDTQWSDEDGKYVTTCGAFAMDNIALSGAITYSTDFETDDGGWGPVANEQPGVGDFSNLMSVDDLPPMSSSVTGNCTLADSVLVLYDPNTGEHPLDQNNVAISPWIDLRRAGAIGYLGRAIELEGYYDLRLLNYIFVATRAQWYPDSCNAGGASPFTSNGYVKYFGGYPICLSPEDPQSYIDFTGVIPPGAEQVRIAVGVLSYCRMWAECTYFSNTTPWFDNVRFAVFTTRTLQSVIDSSATGDTLRIPPGTYTGPGNRDLDFKGKNLVLLGTGGPGVTVIDCQGAGRGFLFQNGEDSTSVVDGFTIRNGVAPQGGAGGGIWASSGSHPTFRNCVVESCSAYQGGGVGADSTVFLSGCRLSDNEAQQDGGGAYIAGIIEDSQILRNRSVNGSGGGIVGGTARNCTVSYNTADRDGGGMYYTSGDGCTITGNSAGEGGGAAFPRWLVDCDISGNSASRGGGVFLAGGRIESSTVRNNTGEVGGGVLCALGYPGTPQILESLVTGNLAGDGGGVATDYDYHLAPIPFLDLSGSTVSGNRAERGGGLRVLQANGYGGLEVTAARSILWGNCADSTGSELYAPDPDMDVSFRCCALDSSGVAGAGTVQFVGDQVFTNPLFCGPSSCETAPDGSGNYTLAAGSPCLPVSSPCDSLIGARGEGCATTSVGGGPGPARPGLAAYPNPFTGSLHVSFTGPEGATGARVEIFDVRGRLVWTRDLPEPSAELDWNGLDASGRPAAPGVYFVRLRTEGTVLGTRVVRLR